MREIKYDVDIVNDIYEYESCMQNDDIRLIISVYNAGISYNLDGATAVLNWLRPDGTPLTSKNVEIIENVITCTLDTVYTNINGEVKFEFEITNGGVTTVFPLLLYVRKKTFLSKIVEDTITKVLQTINIDEYVDQFLNNLNAKVESFKTTIEEFKEQIKTINGYNATTYNFLKYGGKANDETFDNRAVFQTLVDMVAENGGGTIYVPEGTYFFSRKENTIYSILWKSGVSVKGAGIGRTIFKIGKGDISDGEGYTLFYRSYDVIIKNISFDSFTVDGYAMTINTEQGYTHKGKALFFEGVENGVFRDLELLGTPSTAMGIDFVNNSVIDNVNCYECGRLWKEEWTATNGTVIEAPGGAGIGIGTGYYEPENLKIVNCRTEKCGHYGIFFEHQAVFTPKQFTKESKGNVIANNIVINNRFGGIGLRGGSNVTITGNNVYGNKYGVVLDSGEKGDLDIMMLKDIIISSNTITDNTESGIRIHEQSIFDGININGNNIKRNGTYGIDFSSKKSVMKDKRNNLSITNNLLTDNTVDMYIANGTGTKNIRIDTLQLQDTNSGQAYLDNEAYIEVEDFLMSNFDSFEIKFKMGENTTFPCALFSNRDENHKETTQVKGFSILIDENKRLNLTYCAENGAEKQTFLFNEVLPIGEKITLKFYKNTTNKTIVISYKVGDNTISLTSANTDLYTFFMNMFASKSAKTTYIGREWQGSYNYGKYVKDFIIYSFVIVKTTGQEFEYGFSNIGIDKKVIELNDSRYDLVCKNGVKQQLNVKA